MSQAHTAHHDTAPDAEVLQLATQVGVSPQSIEKAMLVKRLLDSTSGPEGGKIDGGKAKLIQHIRRLQSSHEAMQARLDALAEALGACYCWGEDETCRGCHGKGVPGALPADPDRFDEFVLPLLIRTGLVTEDDAMPASDDD